MESNIKLRNIMVAVFGVIIVIGVVVFGLSRTDQLPGSTGRPFSLVIDLPEIVQLFGSKEETLDHVVYDQGD